MEQKQEYSSNINEIHLLGTVVHTCNPVLSEVEVGEFQIQTQPGEFSNNSYQNIKTKQNKMG